MADSNGIIPTETPIDVTISNAAANQNTCTNAMTTENDAAIAAGLQAEEDDDDKEDDDDDDAKQPAASKTVLNCYGHSEVVGRTRSGRVVKTPARYVPTMDNTPYGSLDLAELDPEELAAIEDGDTDEITSEGEEEEQDEKELDAELAKMEPNEMDKSFVVTKKGNKKQKRAEDAWEEPEDGEYAPAPEEIAELEEEEEEDEEEMDELAAEAKKAAAAKGKTEVDSERTESDATEEEEEEEEDNEEEEEEEESSSE